MRYNYVCLCRDCIEGGGRGQAPVDTQEWGDYYQDRPEWEDEWDAPGWDTPLNSQEVYVERVTVLVVSLIGISLVLCLVFCMCYNSRFRHYFPRWLVRYRSIDYLAGLHLYADTEQITNTLTIPAINIHRLIDSGGGVSDPGSMDGITASPGIVASRRSNHHHHHHHHHRDMLVGAPVMEGVLSAGRPVAPTLLTVPGLDSPGSPRRLSGDGGVTGNVPSSPSVSDNSVDTITLRVPTKRPYTKNRISGGSSLESTPNASMTSLISVGSSVFEDAVPDFDVNDKTDVRDHD